MGTSAPTSIDGIEKYLGSGMIRGIGPVYAKKMVKAFGRRRAVLLGSGMSGGTVSVRRLSPGAEDPEVARKARGARPSSDECVSRGLR
jgi:hypothetical protein